MKKVIVLIVLVMLFVLVAPVSAAYLSITIIQGADCESYWQKVKLPSTHQGYPVKLLSVSGTGKWSWGGNTQASLPPVSYSYCFGPSCNTVASNHPQNPAGGGMIYKSDWCDPITGKKRVGPSRSISLPKRQKYLLLDDGQMYCYTVMQTPILGNAEDAWCFEGTIPDGISDFCLQPNYQDLFGCVLENYEVRRVSYARMKSHRR